MCFFNNPTIYTIECISWTIKYLIWVPSSGIKKAVINRKAAKLDICVSFDFSHSCVLLFTFATRYLMGAISQISRPAVVASYFSSRHCTAYISHTSQEEVACLELMFSKVYLRLEILTVLATKTSFGM